MLEKFREKGDSNKVEAGLAADRAMLFDHFQKASMATNTRKAPAARSP